MGSPFETNDCRGGIADHDTRNTKLIDKWR